MAEQIDDVTIRLASPADAAAITRVHLRSWREAYAAFAPAEYLAALDETERTEAWTRLLSSEPAAGIVTWVAENDRGIVGFVTYGPSRDEDAGRHDREIYSIYLEPDAWGHGVARDLMRTVLGELGERPLSLWLPADNERARHFYRRHGFQADGVERYDDAGGSDVLEVRYRRG